MGPKENRSHDNFRIQRADWRDRPSLTDFMCVYAQSCPTLSDPINCGPPGSSVHGIFQARILEQVAFPPPGDLPDPGIKPTSPALAGGFFTIGPPGKPLIDLLELNDIRWRRKWQPTPVFLPGKSHWWRKLVGYSPWGRKESDTTEQLTLPNDIRSCIVQNTWELDWTKVHVKNVQVLKMMTMMCGIYNI